MRPLQETLLAWAAQRGRDLPWRRTRDPWAVLVAELMLQQTQVARVGPRYEAFLARFPTVAVCAAAPLAEVVQAWEGLGYNRRAVNLHRAAGAVMHRHGGRLPDELDALLALPGLGPYTARAVLAFAFERHVAVVDVNAARVVTRAAAGVPLPRRELQTSADALVPPGAAWRWNQAVLDLGATVCTARRPRCDACPLGAASVCAWRAAGYPLPDPAVRPRPQSTFAGSDRQGRGRLVDALRRGPVEVEGAAAVMGWPDDVARAHRVLAGLESDGLVWRAGDLLTLPR